MPEKSYQERHLPKKYTNELFRLIEASGLPVAEFGLRRQTVPIDMARVSIGAIRCLWKNYDWPVTMIYHRNTDSLIQIAWISEKLFLGRRDIDGGKAEMESHSRWRADSQWEIPWEEIVKHIGEWILEVKEAMKDVQDLWGELSQSREILEGDAAQDIDNTPFIRDEQAEISARIEKAREYIRASDDLTPEQISLVEARLDHAEEASSRIGRKDWIMMLNGAVLGLVLNDTITPQVAEQVFRLVVHGIGYFFGYGGPPPHLP